MIRVGPDYYVTGSTMHAMPGPPVLPSRDLVNWRVIGYALDRLELGPDFRLEAGKEIYGQGIGAPSFRHRLPVRDTAAESGSVADDGPAITLYSPGTICQRSDEESNTDT